MIDEEQEVNRQPMSTSLPPALERLRLAAQLGRVAKVVVFGLLTACEGPPASQTGGPADVRDSAGIRIVENSGPTIPIGSWQVASPRALCSGAGQNADPRVHEIVDVYPISEGRVAVLSDAAQEVLLCREGRVVASIAGRGEGPGEFSSFMRAFPADGDSLGVMEMDRVTLLQEEGDGFRVLSLSDIAHGIGTRFVSGARSLAVLDGKPEQPGRASLLILDASGVVRLEVPDVDWTATVAGSVVTMMMWRIRLPSTLGESGFWRAATDTLELQYYDQSGVRTIVRAPGAAFTPTDELWASGAQLVEETFGNDVPPSIVERMVEKPDDPSRALVPAVLELITDTNSFVWARIPRPNPVGQGDLWRIFSSDGEWVTDIEMPEGTRIIRVDDERLWAVVRDTLGLETVQEWSIIN